MLSSLQLRRLILHSIVVNSRRDSLRELSKADVSTKSDADGTAHFQYSVAKHREHPVYQVPMRLKFEWPPDSDSRFREIGIELEGFFEFPDDTPAETLERCVPVLCLANLYGAARTLIAQSTAMSEGGSFTIPNVNMNEVVRNAVDLTAQLENAGADDRG